MTINFPTGATVNQIYSYNGLNWIYTGTYWKVYPQFTDILPLTGGTFDKNAETLTLSNAINGSISVSGFSDYFVTGGTYDSNTGIVTFSNTSGGSFNISGFTSGGGTFTGGTVSGETNFTNGLTANTISATTYQNLPTDIFVTGGTYSNGTATFTNNTGGTFNVSGFTTGGTSGFDVFVTGGTYNNSNGTATFTNNTGGTFSVTGFTTGGTSSSTDVFVTGASYNNNTFTFTNNTGGTFSTLFNTVTGLTINGNLSVTGNTTLRGFTGTSGLISGSAQNILTIIGSGSTSPLFTVQGSSGELFSVTDSLIGSLFSVNDISGLPILEVFSDNTIVLGSYLSPALFTTKRTSLTIGQNQIYSIPTSAYTGVFVDYTLATTDNVNARAGTFTSIWVGSNVQYTDTSTLDVGTTTGVSFNVTLSGGNAILRSSATTTGWIVKTIIRSI
jgi:hypothetical protein